MALNSFNVQLFRRKRVANVKFLAIELQNPPG